VIVDNIAGISMTQILNAIQILCYIIYKRNHVNVLLEILYINVCSINIYCKCIKKESAKRRRRSDQRSTTLKYAAGSNGQILFRVFIIIINLGTLWILWYVNKYTRITTQ